MRTGLNTLFLDCQLKGQIHRDHHEFPYLSRSPLFKDLMPADLLWVAEHGWLKSWEASKQIDHAGLILLVLKGSAVEQTNDQEIRHEADSLIGAMDVISGECSKSIVFTLEEGMQAFAFPSHAFDELLSRSTHFFRVYYVNFYSFDTDLIDSHCL